MGIFPPGVEEDFRDVNNEFTVFMPAGEAFLYLSQPEILYLHSLVNSSEKYQVQRALTCELLELYFSFC